MIRKSVRQHKRRWWPFILVIVVGLAGYLGIHSWYNRNLSPVSSTSKNINFTVISGSTVQEIASDLKSAGLIRSSQAFETYVRGRAYFNRLQAGTYVLSQSMTTPQIVNKIVNGEVSKNLLTIPPGKTIKQIRQIFKQAGYSDDDLNKAFDPGTYAGHPVLSTLPVGNSLEGLLYPDSFQKEATTSAQTLIRESLDEMERRLSQDVITGFSSQGLTTYQGIVMASIVYAESGDPQSEPTVAQVFLSRFRQGMMLGSDVTAFYAAGLTGQGKTLGVDSPYNTRLRTGLPPGPIGNFTDIALKAVAHPSNTDYLYFVAGDNGVIHFSRTQQEHDQAVKQYCTKQCS